MTIPTIEGRRFSVGKYDIIAKPIPQSAHMLRYVVFVGGKSIGSMASQPNESDCRFMENPPPTPPLAPFIYMYRPGRPKKGAPPRSVACVQHNQACVVHPAIGIFEAVCILRPQRRTGGIAVQIDCSRRRQQPAPAQVVIQKQPKPDQPPRAQPGMVRQHETQRANDVRGGPQQHLPLGQRLPHKAECVVFQIAQPAMDQLRRRRRGAARQVALLQQQNREPPPGGVPGNAGSVHAAADYGEVEYLTPDAIHSWANSPDLPPALWVSRTASMRMPRSTDLHMS